MHHQTLIRRRFFARSIRVLLFAATSLATGVSIGAAAEAAANAETDAAGRGAEKKDQNKDAGDAAWRGLRDKVDNRPVPRKPGEVVPKTDWAGIAAEAERFQRDFPDHARARSARKIAATALIHADDERPELSKRARDTADAFIEDLKNPARDRLETKITLEQAKLRRARFETMQQRMIAHAAHARDLIRTYPSHSEGYGYLLALAKTESTENKHALADELLANGAPAHIERQARRIRARLDLVGRPLKLKGAESAIEAAKGKALVVYTWQASDDGFLRLVRRLGATGDTHFIGINLDEDAATARAKAASSQLPGTQFYDGGGLDGPMARQMEIMSGTTIFLVDGSGIVQDVNGQHDALYKLVHLVWQQEGRP